MSRPDPVSLRDRLGAVLGWIVEVCRIGNTSARTWQAVFAQQDSQQAQVFTPVGYYARPAARGARALAVRGQNGRTLAVFAFQDPEGRIVELAEDERAVANDAAEIIVRANGEVHVRAAGGTAMPLARKADVDALWAYLNQQFDPATGHVHATPSGATTTITSAAAIGSAEGTTILRGQ